MKHLLPLLFLVACEAKPELKANMGQVVVFMDGYKMCCKLGYDITGYSASVAWCDKGLVVHNIANYILPGDACEVLP